MWKMLLYVPFVLILKFIQCFLQVDQVLHQWLVVDEEGMLSVTVFTD